jgi:hypothetical protein
MRLELDSQNPLVAKAMSAAKTSHDFAKDANDGYTRTGLAPSIRMQLADDHTL